jgi:perosamine synthetase
VGDAAADFSLFSFGPIKRFTALGGGIVVGNNQSALDHIAQTISTWPRKADAWFFQRTLKFLALKLASTPLVYTALLRTLSALGKDADALIGSIARGFQAGSITPQLEFQPSPRQQRLLFRRLNAAKHSDSRSVAASQILQTVQKLLPHIAFETLGNAAHQNAHWLMPVLVDGSVANSVVVPAKVVIQLRQFGYDATQGATSMRAFGKHCPNAQRIMRQVVYLPL